MYGPQDRWKIDTALSMAVIAVMYSLTGLIFGAVFGYAFGISDYLIPRATGFMFAVSLFVMAICYCYVPDTPRGCEKWVELDEREQPEIYRRIDAMCKSLNMRRPHLYITSDPFPNAYAMGKTPEHAHICLTSGLINLYLDRRIGNDELMAIVGHELSHIAHRDTIVMGVAENCIKALSGSTILIGFMSVMFMGSVNSSTGRRGGVSGPAALFLIIIALLFCIFAVLLIVMIPGAAIISKYAISRNREYLADESSAIITNNPLALASVLRKLENFATDHRVVPPYSVSKWTVNPNGLKHGLMDGLLETHPSTENRIKRLDKLAVKLSRNSQ